MITLQWTVAFDFDGESEERTVTASNINEAIKEADELIEREYGPCSPDCFITLITS